MVDTAGLRDTDDAVERLGIEVSTRYLAAADVVLACGETDAAVDATVVAMAKLTVAPVIGVRTKRDMGVSSAEIRVSAVTGEGLSEVIRAIDAAISGRRGELSLDAPILTRERHYRVISEARAEISAFYRHGKQTSCLLQLLPYIFELLHIRSRIWSAWSSWTTYLIGFFGHSVSEVMRQVPADVRISDRWVSEVANLRVAAER